MTTWLAGADAPIIVVQSDAPKTAPTADTKPAPMVGTTPGAPVAVPGAAPGAYHGAPGAYGAPYGGGYGGGGYGGGCASGGCGGSSGGCCESNWCEKQGLFARMRGRFGKHNDCCNTCDTCAQPAKHDSCDSCEKHGLFSRLRGRFGKHNDCCNTCDSGCGNTGGCGSTVIPPAHYPPAGLPGAEKLGTPMQKDPVKDPKAPTTPPPPGGEVSAPNFNEPAQKLPTGGPTSNVLPVNPPGNINLTTPAEKIESESKNPF